MHAPGLAAGTRSAGSCKSIYTSPAQPARNTWHRVKLPQHSNIPCPVTGHGYNRWFSNLRDKDKIMKYGLIGCGGIGDLRAEALGKMSGQTLVAVCDSDKARAHTVSGKHGGRVIEDWQDPAIARNDDWRKELADAARFAPPARGNRLVSMAALPARLCGTRGAWVVAPLRPRPAWLGAADPQVDNTRLGLW